MSSDYRRIGNEILDKVDATRLSEALSMLNEMVRGYLENGAWDRVPTHCERARKLCDEMRSNVIDPDHVEGIFHAYEGISHLCQAEEAKENKNLYEESKELAKAIYCLEKSQQSFQFESRRDRWNEVIIWLSLGRLYRSQNRLDDALLAFERSCTSSSFNGLSIEKGREIRKVVSAEVEKTRMLFGDQRTFVPHTPEKLPPPTQHKLTAFRIPIIRDIIAAGKKLASDDIIIGHIQQTGEFEFEFEGRALEVELLGKSRVTFSPAYDYVAVQVLGGSMDQAGISPNDYVILQKEKAGGVSLQPFSGDIVAVMFRDEDDKATLKRIHIESNSVMLKPESSNPEHKTRVLRPEAFAGDNPSVAVVGIAIAVLKPLLPIIEEIATGKEKPALNDIIGHIQETDVSFEVVLSQFVPLADAVRILDKESKKVIDPLEERLSTAFDLINRESKPKDWESFIEAISDFCQYTSSTQVNKTSVKELKHLVAELVSKIIVNLSNYKHLASIKEQLGAIVHRLRHS